MPKPSDPAIRLACDLLNEVSVGPRIWIPEADGDSCEVLAFGLYIDRAWRELEEDAESRVRQATLAVSVAERTMRAIEREACAVVAEGYSRMMNKPGLVDAPKLIARAIRNRSMLTERTSDAQ